MYLRILVVICIGMTTDTGVDRNRRFSCALADGAALELAFQGMAGTTGANWIMNIPGRITGMANLAGASRWLVPVYLAA